MAEDPIDASVPRERAFDNSAYGRWVGHFEHLGVACLGITLVQIGDFAGVAERFP